MSGVPRAAVLARALLLLAGLVAVGRLASYAWLEGPDLNAPVPAEAVTPVGGATAARPTPFLLCVIDGLREEAPAEVLDPCMTFWRELAAEGLSGVATTGEPTLTAACVRTLLTGRNPDLAAAARNFSAAVVRENLVERLATAGARVGHAGDASAHQLARPWYREGDVFSVADQGPGDQGGTDDRAFPFALARIEDGVDAMTVHLTRPDHAGHVHGAGLERSTGGALSPYGAACRRADEQLRAIVTAFRGRHPDALVVVAADHGVTERGTHGGGESAARRAPFVAVGPLVVPHHDIELTQAALASTMAVWLGVRPLAFAEDPPALAWVDLAPPAKRAALEAYVNVRLALASSTGARDLAEAIAVRRAKLSAEGTDAALVRLAGEARALDDRMATAHDPWRVAGAVALASLLWLLGADQRAARGGGGRAVAIVSSVIALVAAGAVASVVAAAALVALAMGAVLATRAGRLPVRALVIPPAIFAAMAVLSFAIKPVVETPSAFPSAGLGLASVAAILAGAAGFTLRSRSTRLRLYERARSSPTVLLVVLGVLVGFPTSLRPFVDPWIDLSVPYALLAAGAVLFACLARRARETGPAVRVVAVATSAYALLAPLVAVPGSPPFAWALPILAVGALAYATRGETRAGRSVIGFVVASIGVIAALVARSAEPPAAAPYWLALVASLSAFGLVIRERGDRVLATRLVASLALVLLFERPGAEPVVRFALLAVGAFAGARLAAPSSRAGLVGFAAAIALLCIAAFHALGSTESLSTVNTGAGVVPGVSTTGDLGSGLSPAVLVNVVVQALRFAVPWIALLSMASRMFERRPEGEPAGARQLVIDLASLLAIRGAALILALSIWWPSIWWVSTARAVFVFATGDLVLVLGSAVLVGAFSRTRNGAGVRSATVPAAS